MPRKRPAHRPSRRTAVVKSAMRLFAAPTAAAVTVAEIAEAADMTTAAVYYHFASKDDILLEGLRGFGEALVAQSRQLQQEAAADGTSIGLLPARLLAWLDGRRDEATVWFVTSAGVSLVVEQLRRELRGELVSILIQAAKTSRPDGGVAELSVIAVALLSLLETVAASWLTQDESFTGLGRRKFLEETCVLAERITGV
ncbi:TetR/AcrR family transcriptional regulator [Aeromicrobium sp.]|uniref:TetR/AcrR family transcriptional regulator n=1 Tax=Aeromicrobium sp. TaxID=1871063 RepID=UPI0025C031AE|nr:TetR/AcrR family transcriptional regulator [Aeromicrobium sp.]